MVLVLRWLVLYAVIDCFPGGVCGLVTCCGIVFGFLYLVCWFVVCASVPLGRLLGCWFVGGVLCMFWRITLVLFRLLPVVL